MTLRRRLSTKQRVIVLLSHGKICHLCGGPIRIGERWEVSHPDPLADGGADNEANRAPAHFKCHGVQTATVDLPKIAKGKRIRAKHVGAFVTAQPMPCGRDSPFKKKMNGDVVLR